MATLAKPVGLLNRVLQNEVPYTVTCWKDKTKPLQIFSETQEMKAGYIYGQTHFMLRVFISMFKPILRFDLGSLRSPI